MSVARWKTRDTGMHMAGPLTVMLISVVLFKSTVQGDRAGKAAAACVGQLPTASQVQRELTGRFQRVTASEFEIYPVLPCAVEGEVMRGSVKHRIEVHPG